MKILAFIPARMGSKELKNKNLKIFDGKPLVYYSIKTAKNNKHLIPFVSTDSKKILNYAKKNNIDFNYLRPKRLSGDKSEIIHAVLHALNWFKNRNLNFDAVMLLQPTSPVRLKKEVNKIINVFKKRKLQSIVSAIKYKDMIDTLEKRKNKWFYVLNNKIRSPNRQNFKSNFYTIDGSIYLAKTSFIQKNKSFIREGFTKIFETSVTPMIDINNLLDFKIAEFLKRKFYKI